MIASAMEVQIRDRGSVTRRRLEARFSARDDGFQGSTLVGGGGIPDGAPIGGRGKQGARRMRGRRGPLVGCCRGRG